MADRPSIFWLLNLPCVQAARLISEVNDRDLLTLELASLRLHLLTCKHCRRYRRQLALLRQLMRALSAAGPGDFAATTRMPAEARRRVAARLGEA